jgi:hypothetical protein
VNKKQFLILLLAVAVLGGAGLALVWRDISDYRATGAKIGAKLLPSLKIADVAQVLLQDSKNTVTLVRKDKTWVVQERGGYPASFQEISDLLIKLIEMKVTQAEQVGSSLWPRVDLADPAKGGDAGDLRRGEGAGTVIEFKDTAGKPLARLVLGKKVLKKDPLNPLPAAKNGVPAGRYVRVASDKDAVVVVSDPLNAAEAVPGRWLVKDFFKADRIKTLTVGPERGAPSWKITRNEEWGQWKFAAGGGALNPGAAVNAVNKLGQLSFDDVAVDAAKTQATAKPLVAVADTFDNLVYTMRFAKQAKGDDYLLTFTVTGEPQKARVPEKGEKPEQAAQRDKDFAETRKRLEARLAAERALEKWTFVVAKGDVEPLTKSRDDMIMKPGEKPAGFPPFGMR